MVKEVVVTWGGESHEFRTLPAGSLQIRLHNLSGSGEGLGEYALGVHRASLEAAFGRTWYGGPLYQRGCDPSTRGGEAVYTPL